MLCLEQFYRSIPEFVRNWLRDRHEVQSIERAAQLAEVFTSRREIDRADNFRVLPTAKTFQKASFRKECSENDRVKQPEQQRVDSKQSTAQDESSSEQKRGQKKAFEAHRPIICHNCQKPGHIAAMCKKSKVAFSYVKDTDENLELLKPYMFYLAVNDQACKVLRDSAATMDVVHPSYVEASQYTGDCAWIKQVVEAESVCLPMAKVKLNGPFGELLTEAAVSSNLPEHYPYLFSNHSAKLLEDEGLPLVLGTVQALTRSNEQGNGSLDLR